LCDADEEKAMESLKGKKPAKKPLPTTTTTTTTTTGHNDDESDDDSATSICIQSTGSTCSDDSAVSPKPKTSSKKSEDSDDDSSTKPTPKLKSKTKKQRGIDDDGDDSSTTPTPKPKSRTRKHKTSPFVIDSDSELDSDSDSACAFCSDDDNSSDDDGATSPSPTPTPKTSSAPRSAAELLRNYHNRKPTTKSYDWGGCVKSKKILPGRDVTTDVLLTIPDCSEMTPTFCYGKHYVTHVVSVTLSPAKNAPVNKGVQGVQHSDLASVYMPIFICSWRGVPATVQDRGLYDSTLSLAQKGDIRANSLRFPSQPVPRVLSDVPVPRTFGERAKPEDFLDDDESDEDNEEDDTEVRRVDDSLCKLCRERQMTHCVVPCGHRCLCKQCADRVQNSKNPSCPICRNPCQFIMRVYDT